MIAAKLPLRVDPRGFVLDAQDRIVVDAYGSEFTGQEDMQHLRMFAAAPELLQALKDLRAELEEISGYWTEGLANFAQGADAIITKVEGKQ